MLLLCLSVPLCSAQAGCCHGVSPEGLLGLCVRAQSQTLVLMAPVFCSSFFAASMCVRVTKVVLVCVCEWLRVLARLLSVLEATVRE